MRNEEIKKVFYTVREVSKMVGLDKGAVHREIKNGALRALRIMPRKFVIRSEDLCEWLGKIDKKETQPSTPKKAEFEVVWDYLGNPEMRPNEKEQLRWFAGRKTRLTVETID